MSDASPQSEPCSRSSPVNLRRRTGAPVGNGVVRRLPFPLQLPARLPDCRPGASSLCRCPYSRTSCGTPHAMLHGQCR